MAIDKVGSVGGAGATPALETGKQQFGKVLEGVRGGGGGRGIPVASEGAQRPAPIDAARGTHQAQTVERALPGQAEVTPGSRVDSVQSARAQQVA
jgi:hypothetical protein